MILHPGILALLAGSLLTTFIAVYAAVYGATILKHWDLQSLSDRQLTLERKTYLVSTVMSFVFVYQLGSLFLFIFTADKLSPLFVGAMCAAGTLNVNAWGYPALGVKAINFLLGGVWLLINYVDNQGMDYPLIKRKYLLLLGIAPLIALEMLLQGGYFLQLDPHVITSCCGTIFNAEAQGTAAAFSALPGLPMKVLFYATMALTGIAGLVFWRGGKSWAGVTFSVMSVIAFLVSGATLISVVSPYFYQSPTHHCPFCLLQREYWCVGYPLYLCLLIGVVAGAASGALIPAGNIESLQPVWRPIQRRLTGATLISYSLFVLIATAPMICTDFKLEPGESLFSRVEPE